MSKNYKVIEDNNFASLVSGFKYVFAIIATEASNSVEVSNITIAFNDFSIFGDEFDMDEDDIQYLRDTGVGEARFLENLFVAVRIR